MRAGFIDYFSSLADRIPRRLGFSATNAWRAVCDSLAEEQERWFAWGVAAFGAGAAGYFALATEPPNAAIAAAIGLGLACAVLRRTSLSAALVFLLLIGQAAAFGFAAAEIRTRMVAAPVLSREIGPVRVTGRVEDVDVRGEGRARILLSVSAIEGQTTHPAIVRLTLDGPRALAAAKPGAVISALATLRPPPEPAMPQGYDFGRWAWYQGIGGIGFVYGTPRVVNAADPGVLERLNGRLDELRLAMTNRIERAIPGPDGSIAAALITGERGEIDADDNQAYRDSGLAHVLSISGVHLALAGLGVFWAVRALLALWLRVALIYPIKKWAAAAALLASTFYLAISGGGSPADRSWLMLSMMLVGVMLDRPALSMRSVGLAALLILIVQPENIIDPSFQMSFGAVVGLIALAEWQSSRPPGIPDPINPVLRVLVRMRKYVLGALAVSLVATLATTPLAIYHFDRTSIYSLIANLLAEPVVAFVVMPFAALAVILMPVSAEAAPLHVMGWGVHMMSAIAYWVAGLPGATTMVRAWPAGALALMVLGGLWIALWNQRWRWIGLAPVGAAVTAILFTTAPDLFIARDLKSAAVRGDDGRLIVVGSRPDAYTASQWLIRDGDRRDLTAARMTASCDALGCVAYGKEGRVVAIPASLAALPEDCIRARIVIGAMPLHRFCRGPELIVDSSDVARTGAMAVTFGGDGLQIQTVAAARGARPWTRRQ